jgi:23S rRNA pseudouridine1911/1915/1917 synthase
VLQILLEEPHFLVVNKPSGMFTQAAPGIENVQQRVVEQLAARDAHPGQPFIGLPHRLDRGTSGTLLLARNQRALKRFGEQFQSRKVAKYYLAAVHGELPEARVTWEDYVRKIPEKPLAEIVPADAADARLAALSCRRLATADGASLALVELHTGRMHQIRLQCAARGYPVLGDWSYGSDRTFGPRDNEGWRQCLALHALRLEFRHPQTAKLVACTAPIPDLWGTLPQELAAQAAAWCEHSRLSASRAWQAADEALRS